MMTDLLTRITLAESADDYGLASRLNDVYYASTDAEIFALEEELRAVYGVGHPNMPIETHEQRVAEMIRCWADRRRADAEIDDRAAGRGVRAIVKARVGNQRVVLLDKIFANAREAELQSHSITQGYYHSYGREPVTA